MNFFPKALDSSEYSKNCFMAGLRFMSTPFKTLTIFFQVDGADDLKDMLQAAQSLQPSSAPRYRNLYGVAPTVPVLCMCASSPLPHYIVK